MLAHSSSTGTATLNITGGGSLNASSSSTGGGIRVESNSGDATLKINNAKVTAISDFGDGVFVKAGDTSSASLTVDGGSLTSTGGSNSGVGIRFSFGGDTTSREASLSVSNSALVDAREGGILAGDGSSAQKVPPTDDSSGIVFDGNKGTVYGNETLQEDLTIGEGESLTLNNGASLNAGGHNVIVDGGTVDDSIKNSLGESVKYPPTITTESLPDGTEGTSYSQTLMATGTTPITWSVTSGSLPGGLSLNASTGEITGTPTAQGESTFTVTATNDYGSYSKELSVTIDAQTNVPVTGVPLSQTELSLTEGGTAQLNATVLPNDATNKSVTWTSNAPGVATVDSSGKVTAVASGTATITVTTQDGNHTATCAVTVRPDIPLPTPTTKSPWRAPRAAP